VYWRIGMGILRRVKKGLRDVYDDLRVEVREGVDVLNEESPTHIEVQKLYDDVGRVIARNSSTLESQPEVLQAAQDFRSELKVILTADSRKSQFASIRRDGQYDLASKAIDIVFKYKPKLESSPGFWNQLKAHVNNFIEKVSGVQNAFSTKKTVFAEDRSFQSHKERVASLKEEMKPDEPEPDSPRRGFN
jgi:predicted RNA-binding protein YlqC (UPF0109 family)